jgi:CubicO group peptidase (beta-lactamase class C family)
MKRSPLILFLSLVVTITSMAQGARLRPSHGQQDKNPPRETPTVDQILDKYTQALGAAATFKKLTSRVSRGTLEVQTAERTFTGNSEIYAVAPNKRVEINRLKLNPCNEVDLFLEGFNGTDGWSRFDQFRKPEGAELAAIKLEAEFYRDIKLKELYPKMIVNGTVKIADRWAYVLDATPAEGGPEKMYFDIETGLLVRRDVAKYIKGARVDFVIIIEDYKEIDGIKLPFTLRFLSPPIKLIYKFNEVKHNVPIEDAKLRPLDIAPTSLSAPTTDEYIQVEMKKRCIPGLALVVIKNGEVVKMNGYGIANLEHDAPVTPDTVFELASVTKQFTATAIMLLVEKGKVKLDDPIVQYLPGSPSNWNGITVRHLLTHTGGMAALEQGFASLPDKTYYTTAESFKSATEDPISFKPGERHQYSDVGYFLLGMIIEKASGQRYKDFLADQFFTPLGMTSTSVLNQFTILKHRAAGYTLFNSRLVNIRRVAQHELPSHYGIFSTVRDLVKWESALASGKVVNESSLTSMWTPVKLNDGTSYPYGFGWELENAHGHRVITHTGMTGTEYTRFPDDKLTVIVLTNLGYRPGGDEVNSWGLTQEIAMRYLSGLP